MSCHCQPSCLQAFHVELLPHNDSLPSLARVSQAVDHLHSPLLPLLPTSLRRRPLQAPAARLQWMVHRATASESAPSSGPVGPVGPWDWVQQQQRLAAMMEQQQQAHLVQRG